MSEREGCSHHASDPDWVAEKMVVRLIGFDLGTSE